MKNVTILDAAPAFAPDVPRRLMQAVGLAPPKESFSPPPPPTPEPDTILETTIEGGMRIKNETGYWVDAAELLAEGPGLTLPPDEPQILIIHTHASEAYTQSGADRYTPSDTNRTEDTQFNVVRIGDELTESDPAWRTLTARLCMAHMNKGCRQVNRTKSRLACVNPSLQILIQCLDSSLRLIFSCDT